MENWQLFSEPGFALRFRYPAETPGGNVVDRIEEAREGVQRVHLISRDSAEVYFEVRRYADLAPLVAYERQKAELEQRFAQESFAITALQMTELASRPALSYSFTWGQKARVALLVPEAPALYRIIYDPQSDLNAQVLATVEFSV
jgi:hypothetical protein